MATGCRTVGIYQRLTLFGENMRITAIILLITLAGCSVAQITANKSGTGFNYYPVPTVNDN